MTSWLEKMNSEIARYEQIKSEFGSGHINTMVSYDAIKWHRGNAKDVAEGIEPASFYTYGGDPKEALDRFYMWSAGK